MTKQEEANIIISLKGDTYFAQYFGDNDIEQMAQNVVNDFPVEHDTTFLKKQECLKERIDLQERIYEDKIKEVSERLISAIDNGCDDGELYQIVEDAIGMDAIIKYKHENGIELSDDEIDYLVSKL